MPPVLSRGSDSPCRDVILKALTRLNEKATLRAAAEELSIIVRALDPESLSALVQSICTTTGAWEPKPVAKKECVRVLGQLPLPSCPVADVVLQQHLAKILTYFKRTLQDTDSLVREATSEALAAFAQGHMRLYGCVVAGSTSAPVVRVVFDCLAEQKKESQMGASQALLKMAPYLGPLDKELVKTILKLLRSASFLGTAQLLAAVASTDPDMRMPVGLLKHGTSAFMPYVNHLIGQPNQRCNSAPNAHEAGGGSSGGGSTASSTITVTSKPFNCSGILGCLSSKDWAVRRAAADAMRAAVLLVGPDLEPEDCWGLGDPGSVTGRCLGALEECRFDKVKEAREAAREAVALIHQLHRFVAEQGSDGDWPAWASSHLPYEGWQPPQQQSPSSPLASRSPGGSSFRQLQMSPIAERFRRAAVNSDVVVEPGSRLTPQGSADATGRNTECEEAAAAAADGPSMQGSFADPEQAAEGGFQPQLSHYSVDVGVADAELPTEASTTSVGSSLREGRQPSRQHTQPGTAGAATSPCTSRNQLSVLCAAQGSQPSSRPGSLSGSRPGSAQGSKPTSRPASANGTGTSNSRRNSAQDPLRRQASQTAVGGTAAPGYAAGTRSSVARGVVAVAGVGGPAAAGNKAGCPLPCTGRAKAGAKPQGPWRGPTQQEWQQLQQSLLEHQQLVQQLQQQAATGELQHAAVLQELRETSTAAYAALQERVVVLEVQLQRQQLVLQEQRQLLQQQQMLVQEHQQHQQLLQQQEEQHLIPAGHFQAPAGRSPTRASRSPTRCSSSPASAASMSAAARAALGGPNSATAGAAPCTPCSPGAGALCMDTGGQQQDMQGDGPPGSIGCSGRLYKSAEWTTPKGPGSSVRKSLISVMDPLKGVGHRSYSSLLTPLSMQAGLRTCDSAAATPGDLESAYADALRGERGGVHLLRLIQKTGPVWSQLSASTCRDLLEVFIKHVRDGVMLHRVLPWLWRLADEDAGRPEVPQALQQQLLEALESCPAAEDLQAQEKVCLLLDTLQAVWTVK